MKIMSHGVCLIACRASKNIVLKDFELLDNNEDIQMFSMQKKLKLLAKNIFFATEKKYNKISAHSTTKSQSACGSKITKFSY